MKILKKILACCTVAAQEPQEQWLNSDDIRRMFVKPVKQ